MSDNSKIEWTDASWQPVVGCTKVSEGCQNCYAERMAARLKGMYISGNKGQAKYDIVIGEDGCWNGDIYCDQAALQIPPHWKKPRRIFVCSMGDLFHSKVPFEFIDKVVNVFKKCPQHTGIILTKRGSELLTYASYRGFQWPANIIGMVTAENQKWADIRIPKLLQCGFARTGISCEPLLGPIDINQDYYEGRFWGDMLNWLICGGESGPKARPMHPDWARSLRDQCKAAGVPFFFKQWGEWIYNDFNGELLPERVGKKKAGHLLDGEEIRQWPEEIRIRDYV